MGSRPPADVESSPFRKGSDGQFWFWNGIRLRKDPRDAVQRGQPEVGPVREQQPTNRDRVTPEVCANRRQLRFLRPVNMFGSCKP